MDEDTAKTIGGSIVAAAVLIMIGLILGKGGSPSLNALSYAGREMGKELAIGLAHAACINNQREWSLNQCVMDAQP